MTTATLSPLANGRRQRERPRCVMFFRAASVQGGPWIDVKAASYDEAEEAAMELLRCRLADVILRYVVTRFVRE